MKKEVKVFLLHILEGIETIEDYTSDITEKDFLEDKKLQDAVIRRLEVIGEAVKNLPTEFTDKHKEIPWKEIARMRDKLIHKYFGVDLELTFDVVQDDLPDLKNKIKRILSKFKETN